MAEDDRQEVAMTPAINFYEERKKEVPQIVFWGIY